MDLPRSVYHWSRSCCLQFINLAHFAQIRCFSKIEGLCFKNGANAENCKDAFLCVSLSLAGVAGVFSRQTHFSYEKCSGNPTGEKNCRFKVYTTVQGFPCRTQQCPLVNKCNRILNKSSVELLGCFLTVELAEWRCS
jgi:hypothetical protein